MSKNTKTVIVGAKASAKSSAKAAPKKAVKTTEKVAAKKTAKKEVVAEKPAKAPAKKAAPKKETKAASKPEKAIKKVAAKPAEKVVKAKVEKAKAIAVLFEADCPLATTVSVAGSFNDWSVEANALKKDKKTGLWTAKIKLLPGDYEYKFVCDGINWDEGDNKIKHV